MSNWREYILNQFVPGAARLTLVADPDFLLVNELIFEGIQEKGFGLVQLEDNIAFRYIYESRFRYRWEDVHDLSHVVILQSQSRVLDQLPVDLFQTCRNLAFSLGDIFPNLIYPIVAAQYVEDIEALYEAQLKDKP